MQTCPAFFLKSLPECPGKLLEICSVKSVGTLQWWNVAFSFRTMCSELQIQFRSATTRNASCVQCTAEMKFL